jgi:hypothetical protein
MHLVPSRWEKTGWKYTEVDPTDTRFFQNPNRVNCHGLSPSNKEKTKAQFAEKRGSYKPTFNAETSYAKFFRDYQ